MAVGRLNLFWNGYYPGLIGLRNFAALIEVAAAIDTATSICRDFLSGDVRDR